MKPETIVPGLNATGNARAAIVSARGRALARRQRIAPRERLAATQSALSDADA